MSARVVHALLLARIGALLALLPGCVFCPNLEAAGYTACEADADCVAGRYCDQNLCAPPPWNDEAYGTRQHLTITNESDVALKKGTAIPVRVGDDGVVSREDVGVDGRFTDYNRDEGTWRALPIFRDLEQDRYTAWVPLPRDVPAGKTATLAWIESKKDDGEPTQLEDPTSVFSAFSSFSDATLGGWFESSPGSEPPYIEDGVANVADNQALVLQTPLVPPVLVTFLARVNGAICDEVFIGLAGNDEAIFNDPPSAGLFVVNDLQSSFDVAPTADSFPEPVGETLRAPTAFARITVHVDGARASLAIDGEGTGEDDLRPPFEDASMFAAVQVGGACSVDLDAVWATPMPAPAPTVAAEAPITLQLLF
jgi:hypothetical protein